MSYWSIVVPDGSITNAVTNPSLETGTTGYTAAGASIARSSTSARRGAYSLAITPTAAANDGVYCSVTLAANTQYTFSVDVKGAAGYPYRIFIYDATAGVQLEEANGWTATGGWQRKSITATTGANTSIYLYLLKDSDTNTEVFYADGWQAVAKGYETTYIDGDQDGCRWNGTEHASTSVLDAQARGSGRVIDFDSYGVNVDAAFGIGTPPGRALVQDRALLPGYEYKGRKTMPRTVSLTIYPNSTPTNIPALHTLRKDLIDAVKPDVTKNDEPFRLRYTGADGASALDLWAVYDSGLEFADPGEGYTVETIVLRLIAYDDPFFYEDGDAGALLSTYETVSDTDYIAGRVSGRCVALGSGMDSDVYDIVVGQDGCIYAGGHFTTAGGVAANYIAKWDGSTWAALGAGVNNSIYCLVVGPDGSIYAGGLFSTAGGSAATRIARWDGSSWSALSSGLSGRPEEMVFGTDGCLYVVGSFTTAGGVTVNNVAKWDGSSWTALSTGLNSYATAITTGPDGSIYVGGIFTTAGGVSANGIAKWDGTAWSALGAGVGETGGTGVVYAIAVAEDGTVYIGGNFDTAGGVTVNNIARWNGTAWGALGSGTAGTLTDPNVLVLAIDDDGRLLAGGAFTSVGGMDLADRMAAWNGSVWTHMNIDLPGTGAVYTFCIDGGDFYIGSEASGSSTAAFLNTLTNSGSRSAYPVIKIKREGGTTATLAWIKNETTGATLYFDYDLLDGETLTIDLREGAKSIISSMFGRVWRAILRNSDVSSFYLLPGVNNISVFVIPTNSPTVTATMTWKVCHWSVDGKAA